MANLTERVKVFLSQYTHGDSEVGLRTLFGNFFGNNRCAYKKEQFGNNGGKF